MLGRILCMLGRHPAPQGLAWVTAPGWAWTYTRCFYCGRWVHNQAAGWECPVLKLG